MIRLVSTNCLYRNNLWFWCEVMMSQNGYFLSYVKVGTFWNVLSILLIMLCLEMEEVRENKEWMCPHCIEEKGINPHWICNRYEKKPYFIFWHLILEIRLYLFQSEKNYSNILNSLCLICKLHMPNEKKDDSNWDSNI